MKPDSASAMRAKPERGIALITALLIVAVASIVASGMMARQNVGIHRSGNLFLGEQAWWFAIGAENWAGQILKRDREDGETDHYDEDWAQSLDYLPIEGGFLSGGLTDRQARFNLNNLAGSNADKAAEQFERLLGFIEGVDPFTAQVIVQSTQDWLDTDIEARVPSGAEDDYYMALELPYRTGNRLFNSASELLLVRGVTREIYRALEPFVVALPPNTPINVNTAPPEVLASLAPEISMEDLALLLEERKQAPFEDTQAFLAHDALAGRELNANNVSVSTQYFLLQAQATVGTTRVTLYSLLFRDEQGRATALTRSKDLI